MDNLIKIREVSLKYDISARTLRYYEDMELIQSTRSIDYAYRMYDKKAIKKLEQILILRKLNISVKDIQRIFSSPSSEVVLEILDKKVTDIDDEVALLHELKEIVLEFIHQIETSDFLKDSDIKLLYEKAKDIEQQIINVDYNGNPSNINRLIDISEKLEKTHDIRVIQFPAIKMARSGPINDMTDFDAFNNWWSGIDMKHYITPRDFMWFNTKLDCMEWLFAIPEELMDTNGYELFDFPGGLYAVGTARDLEDDCAKVKESIKKWIEQSEFFEISDIKNDSYERYDMAHVITPKVFNEKYGYHLTDLFIPIIIKEK